MYTPLPIVTEALDELEARLKRERDGQRRLRLHLLVLIRSGQIQERQEAAAHLAVHRNTISRWLHAYQAGGLAQLLEIQRRGAKPGQKTLSPRVLCALQERLDHDGFDGYVQVQHWLAAEYALDVPYSTVHKLVRYRLGAKLKRARPRHAKKTKPRSSTSPSDFARSSMQR
jgi:transposase